MLLNEANSNSKSAELINFTLSLVFTPFLSLMLISGLWSTMHSTVCSSPSLTAMCRGVH